ncbi:MAG: divalent-cation tolerance protein CutA [Candidatus Nitrosoabyssus spongiisocia]|nr:MAG: divalent-cation tolerance protein CutA [Nitrosopumilaceae archaeon AB1(1)]
MEKPSMIISTYPTKVTADRAISHLVGERLAACANIIQISSTYWWGGKMEQAGEYLVIYKTTQKNKKILQEQIAKHHPYDTPEIAEIDVTSINDSYMQWLVDSTTL